MLASGRVIWANQDTSVKYGGTTILMLAVSWRMLRFILSSVLTLSGIAGKVVRPVIETAVMDWLDEHDL